MTEKRHDRPAASLISRRRLLTGAAASAVSLATASCRWGVGTRRTRQKVIVIGVDGMDPRLSRKLMREGRLPNLARMAASGGFTPLGTSTPPQSPVAWATFINGSDPGSHGIFDFIHRHPQDPGEPFFSAAETLPGEGFWEVGDHRLQLDFWPFNHQPPRTVLRRQGTPFWEHLDAARVPSTFYDLPSNYPPSPSRSGYHRCLSGMGTPDMLGTYGTYQHFSEGTPEEGIEEGGGKRSRIRFDGDSARVRIVGPENSMLASPEPTGVDVDVHRDRRSNAALVEVQGRKLLLQPGQWSPWVRLDFTLSTPAFLPDEHVSGICRFLLQEVSPEFRIYVTPINVDPSDAAVPISEPAGFAADVAERAGLFYTTGFKEDHKACANGIFTEDEFIGQATMVLEERLALLEHAMRDYDDGLLFFYFSSSDLQSHILWWDEEEGGAHPTRAPAEAARLNDHVRKLYERLDAVIGRIQDRYGSEATILVMSDHGFANFGRQFSLNSWLRDHGYLNPRECSSVLENADWSRTRAYGLGINGLYLNLKGRERDGIVEPGEEAERLMRQLAARLKAARDFSGQRVIREVYRADEIYSDAARDLAPDLIVGYTRGYRASWETCLGGLTDDVLLDNPSAWSADHCADAHEIPGVLFCNRPIRAKGPSLIDLAPTILAEFGVDAPPTIRGRSIL